MDLWRKWGGMGERGAQTTTFTAKQHLEKKLEKTYPIGQLPDEDGDRLGKTHFKVARFFFKIQFFSMNVSLSTFQSMKG